MRLLAEQAAPSWVPVVAFAVPAVIVTLVLVPALRLRRRARAARRAQGRRRAPDATELGSAGGIDDPAPYSVDGLLKALAVKPEDHGPTADGMPHDEGWAGTMLGLRSRMSAGTTMLEPHVYWGTREGRQVFVRIGPDEKIEGGTTMLSNRHVRSITVLRVAAPVFDVESDDGALRASEGDVAEIRALVDGLAADRPTWSDVRIAGGQGNRRRPQRYRRHDGKLGLRPLAVRAHRAVHAARAAEGCAHRAELEGALRLRKGAEAGAEARLIPTSTDWSRRHRVAVNDAPCRSKSAHPGPTLILIAAAIAVILLIVYSGRGGGGGGY